MINKEEVQHQIQSQKINNKFNNNMINQIYKYKENNTKGLGNIFKIYRNSPYY